MALQTLVVCAVADVSGRARLEMDFDDVQGQPFVTDLVMDEVRVVNGMNRPVFTDLRRSANGQSWATVTVQPGETFTKEVVGAVRRESDLVGFNLRTA